MAQDRPTDDRATPNDHDDDDIPSIDVHQPGRSAEAGLGPRPVDGDPPDAVGGADDRSGGPEDRAPAAPDDADA